MFAAVPALMLAFLLRFFVEWSLALAAFWTTRVGALNQTYFVLMLFLSGRMAPLELFPSLIQTVAAILPFRWMVSFPLELLLGRLTFSQALTGLGAQLVWVVITFFLMRIIWRSGVRLYSAVGA
jgi:ABC-2 type transport system permease protein